MTYFRFGDPVMTPNGPASFVGYWEPERQLAKVKMEDGRYWSYRKTDLKLAAAIAKATAEKVAAGASPQGFP